MPRITSHKLSQGDVDYEFELGFSDAAMMRDTLRFEIVARRTHRRTGDRLSVPAIVDVDLARMRAVISVDGKPVGEIDLHELDIPADMIPEEAWREVERAADRLGGPALGQALEEVLQQIPVPDPVFGCIIKAGVSTTLGQAMRCYNEIGGREERWAWRLIGCLSDNALGMLSVATWRAVRCMATLGFAG